MRQIYCYVLLTCSLNVATQKLVMAQVPQTLDSLDIYLQTHTPTDSDYVRALNRTTYKLIYEKAAYEKAGFLLHQSEQLAHRIALRSAPDGVETYPVLI